VALTLILGVYSPLSLLASTHVVYEGSEQA
jgi:hypothetical protein